MKNFEDILYKPNIDYKKNYSTEGVLRSNANTNLGTIEDEEESVLEELIDKIQDVINKLPLLPDDLQEIVKHPLGPIQNVVGTLPDNIEKPIDKEEVIIGKDESEDDYLDDDDVYPENPFDESKKPIEIDVIIKDKVDAIQDEYEYDLVSIISDYIDKLNLALNQYWEKLLGTFRGIEASKFVKVVTHYNANSKDISDKYKHLSDAIIRNQISRSMKQRLYLKIFSIDETITHLRACKAGVEQRIRYYKTPYIGNNERSNSDLLDVFNNRILADNRRVYDNKYKQNFLNLYKYLNSSVILLNECLNMFLSEAQAKIILLEKEEGGALW